MPQELQKDENSSQIRRKMLNLPPNWWQTAAASTVLIQQFKKHLLPLLIGGFADRQFQYNVYSGIFLRHREIFVWLTAGHVVDEIGEILTMSRFKISTMAWLDGYENSEAGSVPLHRKDIAMKSWRQTGLDIGVVRPSLLDVGNLLKNAKIVPIDALIWTNLSQAHPEGYYAIGFPRPWCQHTRTPAPDKKTINTIQADIACLPLKQILPPPTFAGDPVWSDPQVFYGHLLPYTDLPEFNLEDAHGMSGGPILSVERDPDGRIRYRLVGIIQSFAPGQAIFRAEPINKVADAIDEWLSEE